jgi:hypothetical protein
MPIKQFVLETLSHGFMANGLEGRIRSKRIALVGCAPAK